MKIYLVGGAVRDQRLGLPVSERDWVVVGATPAELLAQGYTPVGRDFPVFLHPITREEYALARTERKMAPGYHGFQCDFNPHVRLEDDLSRRDLTINAMAEDEHGQLIDPYHGMQDIQAKRLRHVSAAFVEDPVRVLRLARFSARFYHLDFKVAEETYALIIQMVSAGELNYLVPERVWQEWCAALAEKNPQQFILSLRTSGALRIILPELDGLFGVPNVPGSQAYIDSGIQALHTLACASQQSTDPLVRFAAVLLELGKLDTPIAHWPLHTGFATRSVALIKRLCHRLRVPKRFCSLACLSASLQSKISLGAQLDAQTVVEVLDQADALRRPARFKQLLAVICAQMTAKSTHATAPDTQVWWLLLECVREVQVDALLALRDGPAIKQALYLKRVARVQQQLTEWKEYEK